MTDKLPPLPESFATASHPFKYTADQLRAYAEEAVRMERERLSGAVGRFTDQVEEYARSRSEVAPEPTER